MTEKTNKKWDFSDYAFTITGIIVGVLLVVPEIVASHFGINILGGSFNDSTSTLFEEQRGLNIRSFNEFRALSPLLFILTTTIVMFKEAIDARKNGGYKGSMFTHTFESLLEDAIYMAITTIMLYSAILVNAMYISWLAGPITWILFIFIFPFVKKKRSQTDYEFDAPWLLLFIFAIGVIAEIITREWLAFPLSWLIICIAKLIDTIRKKINSIDSVFDVIYYAFSVILLTVGIVLNYWIASWMAFPIALFICWVLSKLKRFKQAN